MPDQLPQPSDATAGEPEYLGSAGAEDERPGGAAVGGGRRWGVVAAASAAVVATAGLGGWAVAQLMSGGSDPATAVPAIAVAYLSVDLDPSAGQKIEAIKTLQKFPALAEELDLDARDDVRRWVFEQAKADAGCESLDYDNDVEPWLGDRMAVAAVPDDDAPLAPLLVLEVRDQDAARAGVRAIDDCAGGKEPTGVAFVGDYMLLTEHQDDADAMATAAEARSLDEDAEFADWMERVGEPGVLTAYASADAPRLMVETGFEQGKERMSTMPDGTDHFDATGDMSAELTGMYGERMRSLWKDFDGMAAVVRFADGSVEAEAVAGGLPGGVASTAGRTGPSLADLPAGTAAAMTVSLPDGWLQPYLESVGQLFSSGETVEDFWAEVEEGTGLRLPEDLEAMLGDGFSLSVDASADLEELTTSSDVPQVPVGLRISGDPADVSTAVEKVLSLLGPGTEGILVERGEDVVVVGLDQAYVDQLVRGGDLGDLESFRAVVPEADRAGGALYVNFDAGDGWLERLTEGDAEAAANLAPLDAVGVSGWQDEDGMQHGLFRLTTD